MFNMVKAAVETTLMNGCTSSLFPARLVQQFFKSVPITSKWWPDLYVNIWAEKSYIPLASNLGGVQEEYNYILVEQHFSVDVNNLLRDYSLQKFPELSPAEVIFILDVQHGSNGRVLIAHSEG